MIEIEYQEFLKAYKKWAELSFVNDPHYYHRNLLRASSWDEYVVLRDKYYNGSKLNIPVTTGVQ